MGYRIKTVAELLGVPRNTLLAWERRYNLVSPDRQTNGYREYTEEDLERLKQLKALLDAGYKVGEAISLLDERAQRHGVPAGPTDALAAARAALSDALLRYDRKEAVRIADTLTTTPYSDRLHRVWFPLLRLVGDGWVAGEVSVAQEHYVSGFVRERMMGMLMALNSGPDFGPSAVCAGFPGEIHELGLLGISIELALSGYRVTWLGADVPIGDLCTLAAQRAPAAVCVSVMLPRPDDEILDHARALRAAAPGHTKVVYGGRAIDESDLPLVEGVRWARGIEDVVVGTR